MIYIFFFILSFILTYYIKNYAIKKSLVAEVTDRSSHTTPTPHGGGIAIAVTWFLGISYLYYLDNMNASLYFALMVGVIISVISYMDDLFELSAKIRLLIQSLVAILGLYFLGGFEIFDFGVFTVSNQIFTNIFAFFMIIWFINLYNFLDGIDGYAGSEALFLALAAFILFGGAHFLVMATAVAGFLVWNWHKAKIFMGDVGSTLLGYNIAIFTVYYANEEPSNFWIWIILFGLFWFDATLTLIKRKLNGESLSQAHKKHAYQRLTQSSFTHDKVTILGMVANVMLFCIVYFISNIYIAFFVAILLLYSVIRLVDSKKEFERNKPLT